MNEIFFSTVSGYATQMEQTIHTFMVLLLSVAFYSIKCETSRLLLVSQESPVWNDLCQGNREL